MMRKEETRILRSELNFPLDVEVTALSPRWKYARVGHIEKHDHGTYFYYMENGGVTFQYMDASWRVWRNNVEMEPYLHEYGTVVVTGRAWGEAGCL